MEDQNKQPLITREQGTIVAATVTAILGAGVYLAGVAVNLDDRLDTLEEDAKVLIGPGGTIQPARESVEALYGLKALEARLERLEADVRHHH